MTDLGKSEFQLPRARRNLPSHSSQEDKVDQPQKMKHNLISRAKAKSSLIVWSLIFVLYNAYLAYAIYYHVHEDTNWEWCDGLGFLLILTCVVYVFMIYSFLISPHLHLIPGQATVGSLYDQALSKKVVRILLYVVTVAAILTFLVIDCWDEPNRLISVGGILVFVLVGTVFSKHPLKINWRQVTWGLALQFIFALLILRWEFGRDVVDCLGEKISQLLSFTDAGSGFVFGYLVNRQPFVTSALNNDSIAFNVTQEVNINKAIADVVVFKSLSVIYFFSFISNVLFYVGAIQWFTVKIGWILRISIGTTYCESLNAASNIFLGQSMAPLLIQPYLPRMTRSEIHTVMTSGFATIAGTVMAAYITFGVSPSHLLSASVMSAPAALACAKILYPETEDSHISEEDIQLTSMDSDGQKASNILDAATRGATVAATLVLNITAIVVAFIAMVAFLNSIVSFLGGLVGLAYIDFEWIVGKVFIPVAYMMGVPWEETEIVGGLIGIKTVVNEFIAYRQLGIILENDGLSARSSAIATYALCGFANPGSVGVQIALLSGLCPARKSDFANIVGRAFVAGTMACFMTACIAGALLSSDGIQFDS
ncbi:solute carrier family 28 member 3-like [Tigriopus californicus]|nr:solute carrier family 28 member 3-like [Tigriopus californicus]